MSEEPGALPATDDASSSAASLEPEEPGLLKKLSEARFTWTCILAQLVLYGIAVHKAGGSSYAFVPASVIDSMGAFVPAKIPSEPWRLVTGLFLSSFALHILMSCFLLVSLGPPVEKILGLARFSVLYIVAGAAGAAVGLLLHPASLSHAAPDPVLALVGGYIGITLAATGSLVKTLVLAIRVEGPWLALMLLFNWTVGKSGLRVDIDRILIDTAAGTLVAWPLALQLHASRRARTAGWVLGAVVVAGAAAVVGELVVRSGAAPSTARGSGGGRTGKSPRESPKPTAAARPSDVARLLEEARDFRAPFGPVPTPSTDATVIVQAQELARKLEKLETNHEVSDDDTRAITAERGLLVLIAGDLASADDVLEQAKGLDLKRADVRAALGAARVLKGGADPDEAVEPLAQALALDPTLLDARYWLARARDLQGKHDEAKKEYEAFLRLAGDAPPAYDRPLVEAARKALDAKK